MGTNVASSLSRPLSVSETARMPTTTEIRRTFLDYFARNDHAVLESSPLVPRNDPTLMFTNAGMVPFKNVFTGLETRDYVRAASSQKCVRAGGKHNDLENVGYTARHHTFFEMLGNFSFGDYFKEQAIKYAWDLITKEYEIPIDRLLVTVYAEDDDAFGLWKKIAGLDDSRIIRIATSDNFWQMGDTGPCGPCSEIFFDHGSHIWGGPPGSAEADGDRYVEIWNLVFMQYEQMADGRRVALPKPSIDTGMGLERVAAVLQGKHDNYDIDLMRGLIEASARESGVDPDGVLKVSHRVIADHLRSAAFLIADGVMPSNEGRGYVLRRIMRRAMRHAHILGCQSPLLWRLVPALQGAMGDAYPELGRAAGLIAETLKLEETRFKALLDRGLRLLEEETARLGDGAALPGSVAFSLYDTYGFPLDLTQDVLRSQGRAVDLGGFEAAMAEQRAKARAAWAGSGEAATEHLWFEVREKFGASEFLGYAAETADGVVQAIISAESLVERADAGAEILVVTNQTPFYGESGGQQGDTGRILAPGGQIAVVDTLKKLGALHVHVGRVVSGSVAVGDAVTLIVESERRGRLRAHHSATHLLHEVLRRQLGDHVAQKGSLVTPDRLRFDVSHSKPISAEELRCIEDEVNTRIRMNSEVTTRLMTPDAAVEAGALALFGEKYGEEVRVVAMGAESGRFSVELCGGTHVRRTGDIGLLKIIGESAVAAGVRRIEAVVGAAALEWMTARDAVLTEAAGVAKVAVEELPGRVGALIDERRRLERELSDARRKLAAAGGGGSTGPVARDIGGVPYFSKRLDGIAAKDLKPMADEIKQQLGSCVVALVAVEDGRASLVVGVTKDLIARVSAVDLVRIGADALGGKGGGGRPEMAQAGGPESGKADAALVAIELALAAES